MKNEQTKNYVGDELEVFKHAKNWKSYWSCKIKPLLGDDVLEVGAGIGTNTQLLFQGQRHWLALEPDASQCAKIAELDLPDCIKVQNGTLNEVSETDLFDSIIYIDVLEHIEDDAQELAKAMNFLKPGGKIIVLSPAHQRLYSPFDRAVGHYRRYSRASLASVRPSQSRIESLYYLDSVGCIASWVNAVLMKSKMPTRRQVKFWDTLMVPISKLLDPLLRYKVGKTVIMVLSK